MEPEDRRLQRMTITIESKLRSPVDAVEANRFVIAATATSLDSTLLTRDHINKDIKETNHEIEEIKQKLICLEEKLEALESLTDEELCEIKKMNCKYIANIHKALELGGYSNEAMLVKSVLMNKPEFYDCSAPTTKEEVS